MSSEQTTGIPVAYVRARAAFGTGHRRLPQVPYLLEPRCNGADRLGRLGEDAVGSWVHAAALGCEARPSAAKRLRWRDTKQNCLFVDLAVRVESLQSRIGQIFASLDGDSRPVSLLW